jgi:hypothetical protein
LWKKPHEKEASTHEERIGESKDFRSQLRVVVNIFDIIINIVTAPFIPLGIFAYTVYWAFNIRRAQNVRLYRNQALGMGFVAFAWILIFFDFIIFGTAGLFGPFSLFFGLIMMMLFYWVDASVLAARMADPLLRDTLHWRALRLYLWGLMIATVVIAVTLTSYYEFAVGVEPQFMTNLPIGVVSGVTYLPAVVPIYSGIIALPIAAYRSRDKFLRRSLAWFAGFVAVIPLVGATNLGIVIFPGLAVGAYFLYRSVMSLIPMKRLSSSEVKTRQT